MKKRRFIVMFFSLCVLMPIIAGKVMDMDLFAAGTIINSSNNEAVNSLHTGDEVHLGKASDDVYNVLGQKDGYIYLLKKNSINNTAVNFTAAETQANAYLSETNFGKLGHLA